MGFRDVVQADIEKVFFNEEEFAEKHIWGRKEITAIVDSEELMSKYSSEFECLSKGSRLVMAPQSQFETKPVLNTAIVFDGDAYVLDEIKEELGVYVLFLEKRG